MDPASIERTQRLIAFSHHQDVLLQSYRSLHVNIQSVLLGFGVGVVTLLLSKQGLADQTDIRVIVGIMLAMGVVSWTFTFVLGGVIQKKSKDVNYWQRLVEQDEMRFTNTGDRILRQYLLSMRYPDLSEEQRAWALENHQLLAAFLERTKRKRIRVSLQGMLIYAFPACWLVIGILLYFKLH